MMYGRETAGATLSQAPSIEKEPKALDQVLNQTRFHLEVLTRLVEQIAGFNNLRTGESPQLPNPPGDNRVSPLVPVGGTVGEIISTQDHISMLIDGLQREVRRLQRL